MTNWVITGGCGFIGTALINQLLKDGEDAAIRAYDNLSVGDDTGYSVSPATIKSTELEDWSAKLVIVDADISNPADLELAMVDADVVVHLAANTGVGPSIEDPFADCTNNVLGTLNVLEAARHSSVERVVFASSGAPLGMQVPPLHEEMAPNPASPYGASKLAGEGYCRAYFHAFGLETVTLRFSNVYGPGSGNKGSVVAKLLREALAGESWTIYGDGTQTRDFIYIDDLVRAVLLASSAPKAGGEVFQIATNVETNMLQLAEQLSDTLYEANVSVPEIGHTPLPPGDVLRNFSDTTKAETILDWSPEVGLDEGLRRTVRSFIDGSRSQVEQNR